MNIDLNVLCRSAGWWRKSPFVKTFWCQSKSVVWKYFAVAKAEQKTEHWGCFSSVVFTPVSWPAPRPRSQFSLCSVCLFRRQQRDEGFVMSYLRTSPPTPHKSVSIPTHLLWISAVDFNSWMWIWWTLTSSHRFEPRRSHLTSLHTATFEIYGRFWEEQLLAVL